MELEESTYLTSGSTTKPQLSRQYGTEQTPDLRGSKLARVKASICEVLGRAMHPQPLILETSL